MPNAQELADRWYVKHGPCCAGCDWWHQHNSLVGECRRSAPVPAGHIVVFDPPHAATTVLEHITVDKLACISRAENALRNSSWRRDPQVAKLIQLKGAINRQVNRIHRKKKDTE